MTRRTLACLIAAGGFLLDRITKLVIDRLVPLWETREVIPGFFNIVHTENAAAAFSLFAGVAPAWRRFFLIGSSATAAVLLAVLLWRDGTRAVVSRMLSVGLASLQYDSSVRIRVFAGRGTLADHTLAGTQLYATTIQVKRAGDRLNIVAPLNRPEPTVVVTGFFLLSLS